MVKDSWNRNAEQQQQQQQMQSLQRTLYSGGLNVDLSFIWIQSTL